MSARRGRSKKTYPSDIFAKPFSMLFERSRHSGKVPSNQMINIFLSIKEKKGELWELTTCQTYLCAWEGTEILRRCANTNGGQGGVLKQPVWLHQEQGLSLQPNALLH